MASDIARAHLAWFVGDGAGARARFRAVLPHLAAVRVTLVTAGPAGEVRPGVAAVVELPWTAGSCGASRTVADRRRGRSYLRTWFATDRPDLLVVDGAPDIAAEARAAGVATVHVRRPSTASGVVASVLEPTGVGELAPYPAVLEPHGIPRWLRERTVHAGLLSRYAGRTPHRRAGRRALGLPTEARVVTVMCGRDGLGATADLVAAADATPAWTWVTVGRCGSSAVASPPNLRRLGWRTDPWPALEAADVVVGSGALSVVAEAASARRPLVVVPRPGRADDVEHGRLLEELGAATATSSWPAPAAWGGLLESVVGLDPAPLADLDDGRGPARAADWLAAWAQTPPLGATARLASASARPATSSSAVTRVVDLTEAGVSVVRHRG